MGSGALGRSDSVSESESDTSISSGGLIVSGSGQWMRRGFAADEDLMSTAIRSLSLR